MLTEALVGAVAQSVIERVANIASLEERLRGWLHQDLAQLAFKKAFARAYNAFIRHYPELAASLFDEHFLITSAAPELAKLLSRNEYPNPQELTNLWAQQFSIAVPNAIHAATDFLQWLEGELKQEEVFRPVFDSRALEMLPELNKRLTTLAMGLRQDFEKALQIANRYSIHTSGGSFVAGNVQTEGDFIGRDYNVTHVYNHYFQSDFAALDDYYVRPDAVFQRVKVEDFIGRKWLTAKVDAFLTNPNHKSGALVLTGEAGVGKTSFLAHLVNTRRYLHIFAEQLPGEANLPRAIQSLAAQLVARYCIESYARRDTIPQLLSTYPDFLDRLLRLAAKNLAIGEQIVIVCDALDEAGTIPGGNVLGLPRMLPDGVYLLLAHRPANISLNLNYKTVEKLEAASQNNQSDVKTYLETVARRSVIASQLHAHGYSTTDFVRVLTEKCAGVWMYIYYIIDEIERGQRALLNLQELPSGLAEYYVKYWNHWRYQSNQIDVQPKWDTVYAPLLGTLAAVQEPVTLARLIEWSKVNATINEVKRLFTDQWRAFISEQPILQRGDEPRFKLYHLSLRDFISGKVENYNLLDNEVSLIEELRAQTNTAHSRIVDYYRLVCKGHWGLLVSLEDYARNYLTTHLKVADPESLFNIVASSDNWAKAREAVEGIYTGYLLDLDLAWQLVEEPENWNVSRQIRCALIKSSIYTLSNNIPPELIIIAVKSGIWSVARALTHIAQIHDESDRARIIENITSLLPAELHPEVLLIIQAMRQSHNFIGALEGLMPLLSSKMQVEALKLTINMSEEDKLLTIKKLIPHLLREAQLEAFDIVSTFHNDLNRASGLAALIPYANSEIQAKSLNIMRTFQDRSKYTILLYKVVRHLPKSIQLEIVEKIVSSLSLLKDENDIVNVLEEFAPNLSTEFQEVALTIVSTIVKDEYKRASILCSLIPYLSNEQLLKVMDVGPTILNSSSYCTVLLKLIPYLSSDLQQQTVINTLSVARNITYPYSQANNLRRITAYLDFDLQKHVRNEIFAAISNIDDEDLRILVLQDFVLEIPPELHPLVLQAVQNIKDESIQASALVSIAPYLADKLYAEIFETIRTFCDTHNSLYVLSQLAPRLSITLQTKALDMVCNLEDESQRASALGELIPYLPPSLQIIALQSACNIAENTWRIEVLCDFIKYLLPEFQNKARDEALATVRKVENDDKRAFAFGKLLPHLPTELQTEVIPEALDVARKIQNSYSRIEALRPIAKQADSISQLAIINEMLSIAHRIMIAPDPYDEDVRSDLLKEFVSVLPSNLQKEMVQQALAIVRTVGKESHNIDIIIQLMPYLSPHFQAHAFKLIQNTEDERNCIRALTQCVPYLSIELLTSALETVRSIPDKERRIRALITFIPYLSQDFQREILALIPTIDDKFDRDWLLRDLMPLIHADLQDSVLELVGTLSKSDRSNILLDLIPYLSPGLKYKATIQALNNINKIDMEFWRAKALGELAPYLSTELLTSALTIAHKFDGKYDKCVSLIGLLSYLPNDLQKVAVQEVLETIRGVDNGSWLAKILGELAHYLPTTEKAYTIEGAFQRIILIEEEYNRYEALVNLAPHFSQKQQMDILTIARTINEDHRETLLSALAPYLHPDLQEEAVAVAYTLENDTDRPTTHTPARVLYKLLPHLKSDLQQKILNEALTVSPFQLNFDYADTFGELIPHLTNDLQMQVIEIAYNLDDCANCASALRGIATHLSGELQTQVLEEALIATKLINDESRQAEALIKIAPLLPEDSAIEACNQAFEFAAVSRRSENLLAELSTVWQNYNFAGLTENLSTWSTVTHSIAANSRTVILDNIVALLPMIYYIGGTDEIDEIFNAFQDVIHWWP